MKVGTTLVPEGECVMYEVTIKDGVAVTRNEDGGKLLSLYGLQENTWWDLRSWLARITLDGLKQFKQAERNGYPVADNVRFLPDVDILVAHDANAQAWEGTLDKMIRAFELIVDEDENGLLHDEDIPVIEDGLLEFAAHFRDLWD